VAGRRGAVPARWLTPAAALGAPPTGTTSYMLHGLLFAHPLDYTKIEGESNSLEVVNIFLGQDLTWNDASAVYAEIVTCAGVIGKVEFNHCGRNLNKVTHSPARECFISKVSCSWIDEPPSYMLQSLLNDITLVDNQ
jgi:hypothetical protein